MTEAVVALMRNIDNPLLDESHLDAPRESRELLEVAFSNNVEMIYCLRLERHGALNDLREEYEKLKERQASSLKTVTRLSRVLAEGGIPHAVTKTLRPYPGNPNDSDVLYLGPLKGYEDAAQYLISKGYKITAPNVMQYEFFDPTEGESFDKDKKGGRFYIDFYRELAADHMPYMDSRNLVDHVISHRVESLDADVAVFDRYAEMVILALHSVLMHRTVPLEVVYTYAYFLAEMSKDDLNKLWAFVRLNHAVPAWRAVITIMKELHMQAFGVVPSQVEYLSSLCGSSKAELKELAQSNLMMPHTIALKTFVFSVFSKIRGKRARRGFFRELLHMLNPVFAVEVLYHMLSRKRIKSHSEHV